MGADAFDDLRQPDVLERTQLRIEFRIDVDFAQHQFAVGRIVRDLLSGAQRHRAVARVEVDDAFDERRLDVRTVVVGFHVEFRAPHDGAGLLSGVNGKRCVGHFADVEESFPRQMYRAALAAEIGCVAQLRVGHQSYVRTVGETDRAGPLFGRDRTGAVVRRPVGKQQRTCGEESDGEDGRIADDGAQPFRRCGAPVRLDAPTQRLPGEIGIDRGCGRQAFAREENEVEPFQPAAVLVGGVVPSFDLGRGRGVEFSSQKFDQQRIVDFDHGCRGFDNNTSRHEKLLRGKGSFLSSKPENRLRYGQTRSLRPESESSQSSSGR